MTDRNSRQQKGPKISDLEARISDLQSENEEQRDNLLQIYQLLGVDSVDQAIRSIQQL